MLDITVHAHGRLGFTFTNKVGLAVKQSEMNQANRVISTGKLHMLPCFHTQPINVVVFNDPTGNLKFQ